MELPDSGETPAAKPMAPAIVEKTAEAPAPVVAEPVAVAPAPVPVVVAAPPTAPSKPVEVGTFADKYLVDAGNKTSRRRAGGSMSAYKKMAQNVKF